MYVFREQTFADMTSLAILRNFTSIPLHLVCGITMGHFVSLQKFSKTNKRKLLYLLLSLFIPTLIHTIYNVFFSVVLMDATSIVTLIIVILFVLSIYFIGVLFILKTNKLNNIFINNGYYDKRHSFLMRKNDFVYDNLERST